MVRPVKRDFEYEPDEAFKDFEQQDDDKREVNDPGDDEYGIGDPGTGRVSDCDLGMIGGLVGAK